MYPCLTLLAALALAFVPAPPPKSCPADVKAMQGEWVCVSCVCAGAERDLAAQPFSAVVTDDVMGFGAPDDVWRLTLDSIKSPRRVDFHRVKPLGGTDVLVGVYKVEGDTLTICVRRSKDEKDRPASFDPDQPGVQVQSFKRKQSPK